VSHILVVDDDPVCLAALAQRLRFAFREQGLEVDVAGSAAAALILTHSHHYDALIVDLIMPGVTRFKFIEQLAHFQAEVPIIVMSGFDVERCDEEVRRLGLTAFLPKPIDFAQLCRGLTAVLPHKSRHVRNRLAPALVGSARARRVH
jgi:Response regulator containing CheY-like receiver, AAA-type ATPase, and DNA-binding domains